MSDRIRIMEDTKWNYLFFCSDVFELVEKVKEEPFKGDLTFTTSTRFGDPHKVEYVQWDHYAMIICNPYAAQRIMEIRNDYYFPSEEEMEDKLANCEAYPDNLLD
jgi:hypothetical protein